LGGCNKSGFADRGLPLHHSQPDQHQTAATKRLEIREILGNKLMREIALE